MAGLDQVSEGLKGRWCRILRAQIQLVSIAGVDDGFRRGIKTGIEGSKLAAVTARPRRMLVPQADIQGQRIGDLYVILKEKLPVIRLAAERRSWISAET